jgi:Xaa-Pro aminopeptidase
MNRQGQVRPVWGRIPHDIESRRPWLRVPFAESEYRRRWTRVAERLRKCGVEALIVLGGPGDSGNVRYLTNFESYVGQTAVVVTAKGECAVATNSLMRAEPMQSSVWMTPVRDVRPTAPKRYKPDAKPLQAVVREILEDYGARTAALASVGPIDQAFADLITSGREQSHMIDFSDELAGIMAIKSDAEVSVLRCANQLVVDVFAAVRAQVAVGVSEQHLAGIAFDVMMAGGAEGPCFSLALVGGERAGLKHVLPTDYRLRPGDILFIDFGLVLDGYVTDNARTAIVGQPSEEALRFVRAADRMTEAALSIAAVGTPQSQLDDAAFAVACEYGFCDDYYFRAHGVGTTLFQPPRFNPGSEATLKENEVFSLEPMLVRHGFGSACVERTVLVTALGIEVLDPGPGIWLTD